MRQVVRVMLAALAVLALGVGSASAQEGSIAGTVRDTSGGVVPGVLVEVTSPALIEKVRAATSDANGQYRITNLPVGTYTVTFSLEGFTRQQRDNIVLTTGFTAPVNATMSVGQLAETVVVSAEAPTVDVQNARQVTTFAGDEIRDLPTSRNVNSLLALTPGISSNYAPGTLSGVCSGGAGVFCNPGVSGFNVGGLDPTNQQQGRIMVDGQVINSGVQGLITGMTAGYAADIANAQEVNIQVSGALGESETGGASINIVPRTGGNTFAGNYSTTYTRQAWFADNSGAYPDINVLNQIISDHDVSGAFGGPIMRDRLWFYAVGRSQGKHAAPVGNDFWPNLHEGKWGYNYQPDRGKERVTYTNTWRNANARITWQATERNKFNIFWDEQDFCQDPCGGVVSVFTSPESWWSVQTRPNRLQQVSWTNPLTNRVLLEGGLSITAQHYDTSKHREYRNPREIPRIVEVGDTAGGDDVAPRVNQFAGAGFFALTSGSLNTQMASGGAELRNLDNYRSRASASYVTGSHNAKIGYEGAYYSQKTLNQVNDLRMTYNYIWPAANCAATLSCGNTSLQFPEDPNNFGRRPIPNNVQFNTGPGQISERVMYAAFYAQDQWTMNRLTLNGAIRYDHATSRYNETCVGPDIYVPVQSDGRNFYCTEPTDGVSFKDFSPRWGLAYDLFGNGRTSLKWNMGKYLQAAGLNGVYADANPARRTRNQLQRNWNDVDGDRIVDCDLLNFTPNGECGTFGGGSANSDTARYGRDPASLDAAGLPIGFDTTQCGRREAGIPQSVQDYCAAYGDTLLEGSGKRRTEWQIGIGVQHEILPRLSGEVTYNQRRYSNLTVEDELGVGCDRFLGATDLRACQEAMLNYSNPTYDFYSIVAPVDSRLPDGGGYRIRGLSTPSRVIANPEAVTIMSERDYYWHGIDTNFVWRGPGGLRLNGGTQTGRTVNDDTCFEMVDDPDVRGREGNPYAGGCIRDRRWETRVNGSAAYVIPWADVLVSTVFQSFAGVARSANLSVDKSQVIWEPGSASRATAPCQFAFQGTGCLGDSRNLTSTTVNLLDNDVLFGERVTLFDLKIAKNIRVANTRLTVGADIYNVFNSDAIQDYNDTWTIDNPATPEDENEWGQPAGLVSPRFVRFSVQFYF